MTGEAFSQCTLAPGEVPSDTRKKESLQDHDGRFFSGYDLANDHGIFHTC